VRSAGMGSSSRCFPPQAQSACKQSFLPVRSDALWPGIATPRTLSTPTSVKSAISAELLITWARSLSTTYFGPSFWLPSNLPTTVPLAYCVRPDPRRPGRRQGPHLCAHPNRLGQPISAHQGATLGSTSPRRHPARYAANIAGQT
jgi:hypothetical protein